MATVTDALGALGVTEWILRGEPENEEELEVLREGNDDEEEELQDEGEDE